MFAPQPETPLAVIPPAETRVKNDKKELDQLTRSLSRDSKARSLEDRGVLLFRVIWNDGTPENMINLVHLKEVFSQQLPKMPVGLMNA